jgi:hypothetical protein
VPTEVGHVGGPSFPTLPLGIIRISMSQNSEKTQWENMEKRIMVYFAMLHELPRQKPHVRNFIKTHLREKEYNSLNCRVKYSIIGIKISVMIL